MQSKGPRKLRTLAEAVLPLLFVFALGAPVRAQLSANTYSLNFGNQIVGTQSGSPLLAEFTNTSSQTTYNVVNVTSSLSQFAYFVGGSPVVTPGGVLDVFIWFAPSSAQPYSGALTLTTDSGYSVQVGLNGYGVSAQNPNPAPQGTLSLSSSSVNLGAISVGGNGTQQVTIANSGAANVTISNVSISGAGLSVFGLSSGQVLSPGQNVGVYLSLTPAASGSISGTVTISSDASNPQATISLSASGIGVQITNHSVTLAWNPSSSSGITGYNVYRSFVSGGSYSLITSGTVPSTTYADTNVQSGQTYYYVITAVDSSDSESGYSNEVAAAIP